MKTWKIHLVWSVVTLVSAAAWGQRSARSRDDEFRERERILRVKMVEASAVRVPAAAAALPPPAAPVQLPAPAKVEPEYALSDSAPLPLEEIRRLLRSSQTGDHWNAYQAIQRMAKGALKNELMMDLLKSPDDQIRRGALWLLRDNLGVLAAAPVCQEFLRSDPSAEVREVAARTLGYDDSPGSVETLLRAFQKDGDFSVQVACAASLNDLGQPGPAAQLIPRLAAALESADGALRREAMEHLSQLHSPQATPVLLRALRDSNGDVRLEALSALSDLEDAQILALVEPLLSDPVPAVRSYAKQMVEQAKQNKE